MWAEDSVEKIHACSTNQARNQGGAKPPLEIFSSPLEKCLGLNLKLLDIIQKIWVPLRKLFAFLGVPSWLWPWYQFIRKKKMVHPAIPNNDTLVDASVTVYHSNHIDQGSPDFLGEDHISYCTTVRGTDILRNVIFSGYVSFYQINTFFVNISFFHYLKNVSCGRKKWLCTSDLACGRSVENPDIDYGKEW